MLYPDCVKQLDGLIRELVVDRVIDRDVLRQILGLSSCSIDFRVRRMRRPSVQDVVRLAVAGNLSVYDLCLLRPFPAQLRERFVSVSLDSLTSNKRAQQRHMVKGAIAKRLGESISEADVASSTSFCADIGVHPQIAQRADPEGMALLSRRYHDKLKKRSSFFQRLSEAMDRLILSGCFPTSVRLWEQERISLISDEAKQRFKEERSRRGLPINISADPVAKERAMSAEIERLRALKKAS
ncbi:hypothetical protein [Paraburkholderia pallida]|nr:hypothetical protein [Paraburkholderia pallida]